MEPNYKEMYFKMVNATEEAMRILIQIQQECEEMYISSDEDVKVEKQQQR